MTDLTEDEAFKVIPLATDESIAEHATAFTVPARIAKIDQTLREAQPAPSRARYKKRKEDSDDC